MVVPAINNYVLDRKLGEGGMGEVYLARHNRIDRLVAIKILHRNLFINENIRNRFKNEANALIKLVHPNIVKIYDYVEQDSFACLIMEYIDGITLDDYITKVSGPLQASKAISIISSVLDAVQYAHDNNILHRDIKPGNIMVGKDGKNVRIMDFGIAKLTDSVNLKATHANAQLGTPFYMSPEQVKGVAYSGLSDIYSLGVTLFEMVTGRCPYLEITNLFELQSRIVNEPLPPTNKYYPDVTQKIQEAIKIATHKVPEQRFKNCTAFKTYLIEEEKPVETGPKSFISRPAISLTPAKEIPASESIKSGWSGIKKGNQNILIAIALVVIGTVIYLLMTTSGSRSHSGDHTPDTTNQSRSPEPVVILPDTLSGMTDNTDTSDAITDTSTRVQNPVVAPIQTESSAKGKTKGKLETTKVQLPVPVNGSSETSSPLTPPPPSYSQVSKDFKNYLRREYDRLDVSYPDIETITEANITDGKASTTGQLKNFRIRFTSKGHSFMFEMSYTNNGTTYTKQDPKLQ